MSDPPPPRTGTPVTDAFRKWLATATPEEKQAFADQGNALAASLRENPLRTDVTVLGPDDPNQKPVGWKMYERNGVEVYKLDADFRCAVGRNAFKKDELQVGMEVVIPAMLGGYHVLKIVEDEGKLRAENDDLIGVLQLAEDDRETWVCIALINRRAVEKIP